MLFFQCTNCTNTCLPPLPTFLYLSTHKAKTSCWCCKKSRIEIKVNPGFYHRLKKEKKKEIGKAFLLERKMQQTTTLLVLLPLLWYLGVPQFNIYLFIPKRKATENGGNKIIIKKITRKISKADFRWKGAIVPSRMNECCVHLGKNSKFQR